MTDLLIISNEQFGYHTDSFKYCQYLKDQYSITYLCFFKGLEKIYMEDVLVVYVPWEGSKFVRSLLFIYKSLNSIWKCKGVTFIVYFNGFSIFRLLMPWKNMILDIRTLSVAKNKRQREWENLFLKISAKSFSYVTFISEGVKNQLDLTSGKAYILPLGADTISTKEKLFDSLRLLYVGTLNGRNILDTVKGFNQFYLASSTKDMSYDIVGDGEEKKEIEEYIRVNNLSDIIRLHGYLYHTKLVPLFDKCNIGVSYVPLTNYYDDQPVTKTFEYVFSGLYTIATDTKSNREVITSSNGILIQDTSESFVSALKQTQIQLPYLDSKRISVSLSQYKWSNIVDMYLSPVLREIRK